MSQLSLSIYHLRDEDNAILVCLDSDIIFQIKAETTAYEKVWKLCLGEKAQYRGCFLNTLYTDMHIAGVFPGFFF